MHNPTNTAISFVLLIAVVGAAFSYVSGNPVEIVEPWLGITGSIVNPQMVEELDLTQNEGFRIACVEPGSPAANAGLQINDIITEVEGNKVTALSDIAGALEQKQIGDTIRLKIVGGTAVPGDETLTLVEKPDRVSCTT